MTLLSMLTQTATHVQIPYNTSNARGIPTGGTVTRTDYRARLEETDATEVMGEWDTVVSNWRCYLPGAVAVQVLDQIEVDGVSYEVVGATVERTPRGPHHTVVLLRRRQAVRDGRGPSPVRPR